MSVGEAFRQMNMEGIRGICIIALGVLIMAIIQKFKPKFSMTYNGKPSYIKANYISKLLTSATLFIGVLYSYYFTDLSKPSMFYIYVYGFGVLVYHVSRWGLTKVFDNNNEDKQETP
ncbi:hypothetical protein [Desulfosporosinus sp. SB140]|uniref:hypothetical protein n=1 Tax=Desulfosporosinus paludis TaxID=3115649 RepID=UPI00388EEA28